MRFFLLLSFLTLLSAPAMAQDMLRDHRSQDPTAKLLDDYEPQTLNDYANLYHESCVAAGEPSMKDYVETQCTCTAAELPKFMTLNNMKTLFTQTGEGDFQQARVLLLAYIPCLYTTINEFIFDSCYYDENMRKKMLRPKKVCECYGRKMGNYISSKGQNFVPGFTRSGFNSDKAVPDPFTHIVSSDYFDSQAKFEFEQCVMTESYNFDK
jgi:hypothetical protein